jgi:peptidoglycan/LPS O-acetylase OafA/YrhL
MGGKPGYRADIDGMRAVAVLAVLFFHAGLSFPGGFVGVDVFFVLSGYLITRLIVGELDRGTFTFANFWTRRLRRIWPAASVMTLCTLGAGALLHDPASYRQLGEDAIAQTMMIANFQFMHGTDYFDVSADTRALLHTWSLAVEEQFYLFHPFAVVLIWRWNRRLLLPVLIVTGLLSFALSIAALGRFPSATFYMLPTRAWELLIGAVLAVWPTRITLGRASRGVLGVAALGLVLIPMFVYDRATAFPGLAALPPCLGTAMLIMVGTDGTTPISRLLAWEPLRRIGLISYSLYLAHWPILAFMRSLSSPDEPDLLWRVAAIPASFVLAWLSYRLVEQRFRHAKKPDQIFRVALGSAMIAAVTITLGLAIRQTDGVTQRFDDALLAHINPERVAKDWQRLETASERIEDLTAPIGAASPDIDGACFLFWGDSHGMSISEVMHERAEAIGIAGVAKLRSATTPVPGLWSESGTSQAADANQRILAWVLSSPITDVVLCARWTVEVDGRSTGPHERRDQTLVRTLDEESASRESAAAAMTSQLGSLIRTLESNGKTVWVLLEVPCEDRTPQSQAVVANLMRSGVPASGVTREQHLGYVGRANEAIRAALSDQTRLIDLSEPFFEGGASVIADDSGRSYYMDDDHVNSVGARAMLVPLIDAMMSEIHERCGRSGPAIEADG